MHTTIPLPEWDDEEQKNPTYLRQLKLLNADEAALRFAMEVFYRAAFDIDALRQGDMLGEIPIRNFVKDLKTEWKRAQTKRTRQRAAEGDGEIEQGWEIHDDCMEYAGVINGFHADKHITCGTYHKLADGPAPDLGWHPQFAQLLQKVPK